MMITVIIPTRGRPGRVAATVNSLYATCAAPESINVIVRQDEDDHLIANFPSCVNVKIGPRIKDLSQAYNECCPDEGLVMLGADDILFETSNWDKIVRQAYSGKWQSGVVFGDDCSPGANVFGTHPVISQDLIKKVGFLAPDGICRHIDSFWRWVGKSTGRYQRIGFMTRHTRHCDSTNEWMQNRVDEDLNKARAVFNSVIERLRSPV